MSNLAHVMAASIVGLIGENSVMVDQQKIIPYLHQTESGRVAKLESFSHYVGKVTYFYFVLFCLVQYMFRLPVNLMNLCCYYEFVETSNKRVKKVVGIEEYDENLESASFIVKLIPWLLVHLSLQLGKWDL